MKGRVYVTCYIVILYPCNMLEIKYPIEYELNENGYPTKKGMCQLLKYIRDNAVDDSIRSDLSYTIGYLLGNEIEQRVN